MRQPTVRLGPAALLLTVIAVCLAVLAILTFTAARADLRLAEKYAETVQSRYALEGEGQRRLAEVSAAPDTAPRPDADGVVRLDLESGGYKLHIGLRPEGDGFRVVSWRHEKSWEQEETLGDLWNGFFGLE